MNYPENLKYVATHEWLDTETGLIGLTDYAQDALGDIVFVNLPAVGDKIVAGEMFADVESVKAVSDVFSPVTAVVAEINEALLDAPELINSDPYGSWLVRVEDVEATETLLDADAYRTLAESEAH